MTNTNSTTSRMTRIALFTALICVGAFIQLPIGPVPITLQSFFILMAAVILPPKDAFLSMLVYLLLGLIGIPVFAGFTGGLQTVLKPTFGFLVGFLIGVFVVAKIIEKVGTDSIIKIFLACLVGEVIFYALGIPYMYFALSQMAKAPETLSALLGMGLIPFIPGDLLKMIAVSVIGPKIKKALTH